MSWYTKHKQESLLLCHYLIAGHRYTYSIESWPRVLHVLSFEFDESYNPWCIAVVRWNGNAYVYTNNPAYLANNRSWFCRPFMIIPNTCNNPKRSGLIRCQGSRLLKHIKFRVMMYIECVDKLHVTRLNCPLPIFISGHLNVWLASVMVLEV